jgi:hypothetical protein
VLPKSEPPNASIKLDSETEPAYNLTSEIS